MRAVQRRNRRAIAVTRASFAAAPRGLDRDLLPMHPYEVVPFGLVEDDFVNHAMGQFTKRFERLEKARSASLAWDNHVAKGIEED